MKANDENGHLPTEKRPFRVLLVSGSNRHLGNSPGLHSKSRALMLRMAHQLPQNWEIDLLDLGNIHGRARIQSCNGCVSTSKALCVWPCNCYQASDPKEADLMWDLNLYARLDLADAWAFIGPVYCYAPSSNLKLMFDRLICMNGGNPREDLIDHKNPELAQALEHQPIWQRLSVNHLEGRSAAFFCYGDGNADEREASGKPKALRNASYFKCEEEPFKDLRDAYAPLVWQCRSSGIEVPDELWTYVEFGRGKKRSENQIAEMLEEDSVMQVFDEWSRRFQSFVHSKGKVEPGKHRAFGYKAPQHKWADLKLRWRQYKIEHGLGPAEKAELQVINKNLKEQLRKSLAIHQ